SSGLLALHSFPTRRSSDLVVFFIAQFLDACLNVSAKVIELQVRSHRKQLRFAAVGGRPHRSIVLQRETLADIDTVLVHDDDFGRDRKSTRLNSSHVKISYA